MTGITLVLARNRVQYDAWCRERGVRPYSKDSAFRYASSGPAIDGMRVVELVELEGFRERPDAAQIEHVAGWWMRRRGAAS